MKTKTKVVALFCATQLMAAGGTAHSAPSQTAKAPSVRDCSVDNDIISTIAAIEARKIGFKLVLADTAPEAPYEMTTLSSGMHARIAISETSAFWTGGWASELDHKMVHRWKQNETSTMATCWSTQQIPTDLRLMTAPDISDLLGPSSTGTVGVLSATAPVYNDKKTTALVFMSIRCRGLCGNAQFIVLRKIGGVWKEVGSRTLYIS